MEILRRSFGEGVTAINCCSEIRSIISDQDNDFPIRSVSSTSLHIEPHTIQRYASKITKYFTGEVETAHDILKQNIDSSIAALALGGDNFSLEYGKPYKHLGWNAVIRNLKKPVFIWGASIGPFSDDPHFEKLFVKHARSINGIFVRESESYKYLSKLGLEDKVKLVADPAFVMKPTKPAAPSEFVRNAIGVNLSPLMAKFAPKGNAAAWKDKCIEIIYSLARSTDRNIVLIPHVNAKRTMRNLDQDWYNKDDFSFLSELISTPRLGGLPLTILSDRLSAPELKYEISKLWAFIGARTHATIAAFSTKVPCISLSYSIKSRGLNQDLFDCLDFCIAPDQVSSQNVCSAIKHLDKSRSSILVKYDEKIEHMMNLAYSAGDHLKSFLLDTQVK